MKIITRALFDKIARIAMAKRRHSEGPFNGPMAGKMRNSSELKDNSGNAEDDDDKQNAVDRTRRTN